jgi:hypothetical protein
MTVYPYIIVADSLGTLEALCIERKTRKKARKTKAVKKTKKGRKA